MSMPSDEIDRLLFGVKVCARCGEEKPANSEHYGRHSREPDGLHHTCKACRQAREGASHRRRAGVAS